MEQSNDMRHASAQDAPTAPKQTRYTMVIRWSEEDQLYLAYFPMLPGCVTHGTTYVEAAEMGVEAMELWLEATDENGGELPGEDTLPGYDYNAMWRSLL